MISIQPGNQSGAQRHSTLCLTLTGCLGMTGIGPHGVAVTINNLSMMDGRVGVPWPAVVRSLLAQPSARAAAKRFEQLPLGGGHFYVMADGTDYLGYETSGELKVRTQVGPRASHVHTNHCFDPVLRQRERVPHTSTTFARLNTVTTLFAQQRPSTLDDVWTLLGSPDGHPTSICMQPHGRGAAGRHAPVTCGRIAYELSTGRVRAARGWARDDPGLDLRVGVRGR